MCTATPTGESTRSAMGEFSSRIMRHISPKEKTPNFGLNDDGYIDLKRRYEEANQDTHRICAEYITAAFKQPGIMTLINLEKDTLFGSRMYEKSKDDTEHLVEVDEEKSILVPDVAEQVKDLKELEKLCKNAKKRESRVKYMLRKHEKKNGYEKSPSHEKYQSKKTIKRLKAEAKPNKKT
ncbi:hypothetical protein BASA60_011234 [Batrachochytrium salamandrivorans]|nr:hypothetical protein BASA60_011234 [Batrachochytrium salamandrivorans]